MVKNWFCLAIVSWPGCSRLEHTFWWKILLDVFLQIHSRRSPWSDPAILDRTPWSKQWKHCGIQQQKVLAQRCTHASNETWCKPGAGSVLGHQEPSATVSDHSDLGEQLRVCVQQRQSQPTVQHVWLWVSHSAKVPHQFWRIHPQRWSLELTKWGLWQLCFHIKAARLNGH